VILESKQKEEQFRILRKQPYSKLSQGVINLNGAGSSDPHVKTSDLLEENIPETVEENNPSSSRKVSQVSKRSSKDEESIIIKMHANVDSYFSFQINDPLSIIL